ncbi:unnamed protein product [Effrenium voratum]|uniref:Domain of unknown function at the cortex 1 domain-containing protein n=1 Tax=Effrenium voratum TaxID=2562239 RepID=A0AA36N9F0_9DINO|nr:unnamed protein product [Effrenium voratum]CAJ1403970.1 unnamed protein product [Effrenium voratum]CAJ1460742.1 unnamed protein product [Effrenium voratum]
MAIPKVMEGMDVISTAVGELLAEPVIAPLAVCMALAMLALMLRPKGADTAKKAGLQADQNDSYVASFMQRMGVPEETHVEGCILPGNNLVINQRITEFENEFCSGKLLDLHRATHDKELDKSGEYMYGNYFIGKKRLWETRVQLKFRKPPNQKDVFFGVENEEYVPMTRATKSTMDGVVRMLRNAVGNQIYHSVGDNPEDFRGSTEELELPTFVMPMWAFDQFIVTPEGETPPDLDDECIPDLGSKRSGRVREFRKELDNLVFEVGPTYTFCFWGISQWLDKFSWQIRLPLLGRLDVNQFCGRPPVHVVIYTLIPSEDNRHLQSRKQYYLNVPFWSSKKRPPAQRVMDLLGNSEACDPAYFSSPFGGLSPVKRQLAGRPSNWFACCAGGRP